LLISSRFFITSGLGDFFLRGSDLRFLRGLWGVGGLTGSSSTPVPFLADQF